MFSFLSPTIQNLLNQFEKALNDLDRSDTVAVNEIFEYQFQKPGKRLRPLLLLTLAKIIGYEQRHMQYACAIELIHNATLAHDDVVDESSLRRGSPTINATYGNSTSVLFGDYLFTKAIKILLKDSSDRLTLSLVDNFVDTINVMSEGEIKQLMESHSTALSEEVYYQIIYAKTTKLIELACILAPMVKYSQNHPVTVACKSYGYHLGNAFQIIDDVIDYTSSSKTMGKQAGDDFSEGKITLPLIRFFSVASKDKSDFVKKLLDDNQNSSNAVRKENFEKVKEVLNEYNCFEFCREQAKKEIEAAKASLSIFEDCEFKQDLLNIADYILKRVS